MKSLAEQLLDRLAIAPPSSRSPDLMDEEGFMSGSVSDRELNEALEGVFFQIRASEVGLHSVTLRSLRLSGDRAREDLTLESLQELAARLSYLGEPLRLIEYTANEAEGIIRSEKPDAYLGKKTFFHLSASKQHLELVRVRRQGSAEEHITFTLSLETWSRLIDDLVTFF